MTRLEMFRIKNGFTLQKLQYFLATHGIKKSLTTIYRWCQGPTYMDWREPRPRDGINLAKILQVPFQEIYMDFKEEKKDKNLHVNV
jgi:hypothetical protein